MLADELILDNWSWFTVILLVFSLVCTCVDAVMSSKEKKREQAALASKRAETEKEEKARRAKFDYEKQCLQIAREELARREAAEKKYRKEVVAQGLEEWDRELREAEIKEKVNGFVQEEQAWDQGRQMGYMVIEARPTSDAEKRRSKAALDAKIMKERDASE